MNQPDSPVAELPPPSSLINLDRARKRFGAEQVEQLIELAYAGDPTADAVIKEMEELGMDASHKLRLGIEQGLKQIEKPSPAIQTFLEAAERIPDWVDLERLKRGSEAYLSIGRVWILLSLGPGSLTHTYSSPSIASVLVKTGNLTRMAQRRLLETGVWNIESVLPGNLLRGAEGYVHNLQVRLLHARVRATLLKRDWDLCATGLPINQLEMTRTWLDFTYIPFKALQQFGITFSPHELADLYHFWQYIAYLLGIDERLYRKMIDQKSAQEVTELIDSTMANANEDSRLLTQAMLESVSVSLQSLLNLSPSNSFRFASAITRRLHGDELADRLGIKKTWMSTLMPFVALVNRVQHAWNRRNPAARGRAVTGTATELQQIVLQGQTAYQRNVDDPARQHLPKVEDL